MANINDNDKFLVNRNNTSYQVEAQNLMAELQDNDLMLVNRSNASYKVTGAEMKRSLGPSTDPAVIQSVTLTDENNSSGRFTNEDFTTEIVMSADNRSTKELSYRVDGNLIGNKTIETSTVTPKTPSYPEIYTKHLSSSGIDASDFRGEPESWQHPVTKKVYMFNKGYAGGSIASNPFILVTEDGETTTLLNNTYPSSGGDFSTYYIRQITYNPDKDVLIAFAETNSIGIKGAIWESADEGATWVDKTPAIVNTVKPTYSIVYYDNKIWYNALGNKIIILNDDYTLNKEYTVFNPNAEPTKTSSGGELATNGEILINAGNVAGLTYWNGSNFVPVNGVDGFASYLSAQSVVWDRFQKRFAVIGVQRLTDGTANLVDDDGGRHFFHSVDGINWEPFIATGDVRGAGAPLSATPFGLITRIDSNNYWLTMPGNPNYGGIGYFSYSANNLFNSGMFYMRRAWFLDDYNSIIYTSESVSSSTDRQNLWNSVKYNQVISQDIVVPDSTSIKVGNSSYYKHDPIPTANITSASGTSVSVADSTYLEALIPGQRYYGSNQDTTGAGTDPVTVSQSNSTSSSQFNSTSNGIAVNPHTGRVCVCAAGGNTGEYPTIRYTDPGGTVLSNVSRGPNYFSNGYSAAAINFGMFFIGWFDSIQCYVAYGRTQRSEGCAWWSQNGFNWVLFQTDFQYQHQMDGPWNYCQTKKLWVNCSYSRSPTHQWSILTIDEFGILKREAGPFASHTSNDNYQLKSPPQWLGGSFNYWYLGAAGDNDLTNKKYYYTSPDLKNWSELKTGTHENNEGQRQEYCVVFDKLNSTRIWRFSYYEIPLISDDGGVTFTVYSEETYPFRPYQYNPMQLTEYLPHLDGYAIADADFRKDYMLTTDGNSFETMTPNGIIGRAGSSSGSAFAGKWSGVPFYNRYNDSLDTVSYDSSGIFYLSLKDYYKGRNVPSGRLQSRSGNNLTFTSVEGYSFAAGAPLRDVFDAGALILNADEATNTYSLYGTNGYPSNTFINLKPSKESFYRSYLRLDDQMNVIELVDQESPVYEVDQSPVYNTIKFPAAFASGVKPDDAISPGSSLTVEVKAYNGAGESPMVKDRITPGGAVYSLVPYANPDPPLAVNGYYPLYRQEATANDAGDGASQEYEFDGETYYMPSSGVTTYLGNYNP